MVDAKTTIINNQAEIYEDYNQFGFSDVDSKTKNKAQNEDDLSYADLIITLKTGSVVTYTFTIIIILSVVASGIYVARKKIGKFYN